MSPTGNYCDTNVVVFFSHNYKTVPKYAVKAQEVYKRYCEMHGHAFYNFNHSDNEEQISPYWLRVRDFMNLSEMYDDNTIFVYLDMDTCINPKHMNISIQELVDRIESSIESEYDIFIGADPIHILNTGAIIMKNTEWSRMFTETWYSKYDPDQWKVNNSGKWQCSLTKSKKCNWAREGYEQGELNIMFENNEIDCTNHIYITHPTIMSFGNVFFDAFIYHFMGGDKDFGVGWLHRRYRARSPRKS